MDEFGVISMIPDFAPCKVFAPRVPSTGTLGLNPKIQPRETNLWNEVDFSVNCVGLGLLTLEKSYIYILLFLMHFKISVPS